MTELQTKMEEYLAEFNAQSRKPMVHTYSAAYLRPCRIILHIIVVNNLLKKNKYLLPIRVIVPYCYLTATFFLSYFSLLNIMWNIFSGLGHVRLRY